MAVTFTYPTSATLRLVEREKMPVLVENDPIFDDFPIVDINDHVVMWDQLDNLTGLQQVRGLNGQPGRVQPKGGKRYIMTPGAYGEFIDLDEMQLTIRAQWGTFGTPVKIDDMVADAQDYLLGRRLDRIRNIIWTLLTQGVFSVSGPNGAVIHTDAYTFQQVTAAVAWGTFATATPLADMRSVRLKARGKSVSFGRDAKAYMNQKTMNKLLSNANANDLAGRRADYGATFNSLDDSNKIFLANDLPMFVMYDDGYFDDAGTFTPFIPDDVVVVIGKRPPGQTVGEYQMTRNINGDGSPGPYTRVIDRGETQIPRSVEVHDGHNGGPAFFFPSAVVVLDVTP